MTDNPDELVFYTNPMSRGRIAHWMLQEVGAPYRTVYLEYGAPMKDDSYRAINPMGKVPALQHRGQTVTECAAICAYLADAFPQAGLAPAPGARAAYYRWLFFAAGPLEAAITNRALQVEVPKEKAGFVGYGSLESVLDALEQAVAGREFIAGDAFSAADVYVGSQIGWGLRFKTIEARPAFQKYWASIAQRPALKRANAIDDAQLSAKPA